MKILTVAIPCYNSQEYMEKSIRSALNGGDRVEIIIVDDGSTDDTLKIARKYQEKFPDIVKVIHQENGGHGEAVNTGIKNATGLYFKVLDSDDCLGKKALTKVLDLLEDMIAKDAGLDMLISNYMYDKQGVKHKKIMKYKRAMPVGKMFGWDELHFGKTQYLLMHSVIYRTKVLRECGMVLPKHTFYVDNIYVYYPLPHVRKIYYLDVDFYRYYIGREDQSVNEKTMISRIDQQIFVTKSMIDMYQMGKIKSKKLRAYMINYLAIMMTVSSILAIRSKKSENLEKKKELWNYLRTSDWRVFVKIRWGILGQTLNIPGKPGREISSLVYSVARRIIGFN